LRGGVQASEIESYKLDASVGLGSQVRLQPGHH